jgi:hypothetical protein
MGTIVKISGAVDRNAPDPTSPSDPTSRWIGMVVASWTDGEPREKSAAVLKVATGRGCGDVSWGAHVLVLRWIGDPPPPEVAQTVYDVVYDGGPGQRAIATVVDSQPRSAAQPSYRVARAS